MFFRWNDSTIINRPDTPEQLFHGKRVKRSKKRDKS